MTSPIFEAGKDGQNEDKTADAVEMESSETDLEDVGIQGGNEVEA